MGTTVYSFLCKQPAKRSVLLLLVFFVLLGYTLLQDYSYPFRLNMESDVLLDASATPIKSHLTYCTIYKDSGDTNVTGFECVKTRTTPPTTVCIYDQSKDRFISHDLKETGEWEPGMSRDILESLRRNRKSGFIDLGANVGFYTLLAVKMGHSVVAVEPYLGNLQRLQRALVIEGTAAKVTILQNAISDIREKTFLHTSFDNQGDHRLSVRYSSCHGACPPAVDTILLDDLLEVVNFTSAILKLDIQGYEHRAFQHASSLLSSVTVQTIFMEWLVMRSFFGSRNHTSTDKTLVIQMIRTLFGHDFRPYCLTSDGGKPLEPSMWHRWPLDVVWHRLPSEKEQQSIIATHYLNWPP